MRLLVASIIAISSAPLSSALAGDSLLYENRPIAPTPGADNKLFRDGNFSDSMNSEGLNYHSQAFGQSFQILSEGTTLSKMTIWGSCESASQNPSSLTALDPAIVALQVSLYRIPSAGSAFPLIQQWNVPISLVTQLRTNTYTPNLLTPVFQLDFLLGNSPALAAGSYMLSVGGVLNDPDAPAFIWTDGERDGSLPGVGNTAYGTYGEVSTEWGLWLPVVDSQASGSMLVYGIPAPGAITALLLAGVRRNRRRG